MQESVPEDWIKSLKKLEKLDVDIIIPGHGDASCGKEYLKEQVDIIELWVDAIRKAIKQGWIDFYWDPMRKLFDKV